MQDTTLSAHKYLRELASLRQSMRRNHDDHKSAWAGTRFRYFIDANIVASYTGPEDKIRYFSPLPEWLEPKPFAVGIATLLLEFVFSGKLPGQEGPLYLTPLHFDEVESMARAICKRGERDLDNLGDEAAFEREVHQRDRKQSAAIENIQKLKLRLSEGGTAQANTVDQVLQNLPDLFGSSGAINAAEELLLLERILRESRIAHAEGCSWFHSGLFSPDEKLLKWIEDELRKIRRRGIREETIRADAVSLLQIMMLEAECPPNVRYVFITGDESIHRVYEQYRAREKAEGRTAMWVTVRSLREYVPLINMQSMSAAIPVTSGDDHDTEEQIKRERADVFYKMEAALGISDRSSEAQNAEFPESGAIALKDSDWLHHRNEVTGLWRQASVYSFLLNFALVYDRTKYLRRALRELIDSSAVHQRLYDLLGQTIDKIGVLHVVAAIRSTTVRRAPLFFKRELFKDFIGQHPIDQYLDLLQRREVEIDYDKLADPAKEEEALLFRACVALAAGRWEWARELATRALKKFEDMPNGGGDIGYEARYCLAMALRFTLRDEYDLEKARRLLLECIEEHRKASGQRFRLARALAEASALTGTFLYAQHLNPNISRLSPSQVENLADECLRYIDEAQDVLDERIDERSEFGDQRVGLQAFSNLASLVVFKQFAMRRTPRRSRDALHHDWRELKERMNTWERTREKAGHPRDVPKSVRIPAAVMGVLVGQTAADRKDAYDLAVRLVQESLASETLPEIDRWEYEFYQKCLETAASELK